MVSQPGSSTPGLQLNVPDAVDRATASQGGNVCSGTQPGKKLFSGMATDMLSESRGVVHLAVHARPGAKRNAVVGLHDGALKLAVSAPPVDGKANDAITSFIAESMRLPGRNVAVVSGQTSRRKVLSIAGITLEEVRRRIEQLLGERN